MFADIDMKSIILIRHAKSSWAAEYQTDFERGLNERGLKDAPVMAERLQKRNLSIDGWVSSPANRALSTARIFVRHFEVDPNQILLVPSLYHASSIDFSTSIESLDNHLKSVVLFSHNPGITEFANLLVPSVKLDNMPTCSMFAATADVADWVDFLSNKRKFLFFDYPKSMG